MVCDVLIQVTASSNSLTQHNEIFLLQTNTFSGRAYQNKKSLFSTTMTANTPLAGFLRQQPDFIEPSSSSSPLPALYADLAAHRSSNRSSFEASVDWWARLLFKAALIGVQTSSSTPSSTAKGKQAEGSIGKDRLVLHLNQQLIEECTIEEVGRPLGLGTVAVSEPEPYT